MIKFKISSSPVSLPRIPLFQSVNGLLLRTGQRPTDVSIRMVPINEKLGNISIVPAKSNSGEIIFFRVGEKIMAHEKYVCTEICPTRVLEFV